MNEIDEFLRANKPAVHDDPTFLLETRRRLEAVEGIKAEVDRQRSRGRLALVFALAIGLAVGVLATAIAFLSIRWMPPRQDRDCGTASACS